MLPDQRLAVAANKYNQKLRALFKKKDSRAMAALSGTLDRVDLAIRSYTEAQKVPLSNPIIDLDDHGE